MARLSAAGGTEEVRRKRGRERERKGRRGGGEVDEAIES